MITDSKTIEALMKIEHIDFDKADSIVSGFKRSADLEQMRDYWHGETAMDKAKAIQKHWC